MTSARPYRDPGRLPEIKRDDVQSAPDPDDQGRVRIIHRTPKNVEPPPVDADPMPPPSTSLSSRAP